MLKIKIFILLLFLGTAACVSNASKNREYSIVESNSYEASLFRQNCAICHGQEGNGKEINGVQTPSLRYGDAAQKSETEIYAQIHDGKLPMPAFKNQLTDDEINKLVIFIRRDLQGKTD